LGGEIPEIIRTQGVEKAEEILKEYIEIFKDDFYLELMRHGIPEQTDVNRELIALSKKLGVKVIATNDVHYVDADDYDAHTILICLNTNRELDEENDMHYTGQEYLKTQEEMTALFSDVPEAIENTQKIVEKIENFSIFAEDVVLPVFPLPDNFTDENEYLKYLTYEGAKRLYPEITETLTERIEYELSVIKKMGYPGYFLIVQDFINAARKMDVLVGPGRGSAAGSVVAYCIGITNVDPIRYKLLFERFLNPDRISMPDIDVDFDDEGRDKVLKYVVEKYGESKVAQIVTFGTMAAKSAIRDVARVLKLPLPEADRLAKLVPERPNVSLEDAFKEVPELAQEKEKGSELIRKTLNFAQKLEGSARHTGTHACGVIIGPQDLINHLPMATAKDSELMVTQYEGKLVEKVGMLKMDFLGLANLSIIKDTVQSIYERHNVKIDMNTLPMDDELTYQLFQQGDTVATFQFESEGMRLRLRELKPNCIEDLIAMNALYRPGPMENIPNFINRKQGREKIVYAHPLLEGILKDTYGIMVYQEQIMQISQALADFSGGKADELRKAMGKKNMSTIEKLKKEFIEGCGQKSIEEKLAIEIYELMGEFAKYGFNRSHAAAYSIVAYQTGYLKAHYPAEYMASVLTHNLNNISKITFYIEECNRIGIKILGPDVNESYLNFNVNVKGQVRFGLAAIKGVGASAAEAIIMERKKNGVFRNIFDFVKRINLRAVNKRCLEALAYAGAFDGFDATHRAQFFYKPADNDTTFIEKLIKSATNFQNRQDSSQHSLFGDVVSEDFTEIPMPVCEPWSMLEQLKMEKEVTGFYFSGHPLDDYKFEIDNYCNVKLASLKNDLKPLAGRTLYFAGIVTASASKTTKTGKPFGNFTIEDFEESYSISLFSEEYLRLKHFLEVGHLLYITAIVQPRFSNPDLLEMKVQNIMLLQDVMEKLTHTITVSIPVSLFTDKLYDILSGILKSNKKGNSKVKFIFNDDESKLSVSMNPSKLKTDAAEVISALYHENLLKLKVN
jgi:DNA polymerase-3 subunit alpha